MCELQNTIWWNIMNTVQSVNNTVFKDIECEERLRILQLIDMLINIKVKSE